MAAIVDTEMTQQALGKFLLKEINRRGLSHRSFAELVGVSHQTIGKLLVYDGGEKGRPSLDILHKISKATGVDICTLIGLVMPEADLGAAVSADDRLLLARMRKLPQSAQEFVETALVNAAFEQREK